MIIIKNKFSTKTVNYYFDSSIEELKNLVDGEIVFVTDKNIYTLHQQKFGAYKTIVIEAGEAFKQQATVDFIISKLIRIGATRKTTLVGVGGGVVTDITGYAASVYMRGINFAFVPTTILAMVDAVIGGKNGVDVGVYKNLVGTINQPQYLLYDLSFLQTLPNDEWVNGFAEIIKHACMKDVALFVELENNSIENYRKDELLLSSLIQKNSSIKTNVVLNDEFEKGERKQLNFGHTFGHAIENLYQLPHGHAVSIGMCIATKISEEINGFYSEDRQRLENLIRQYHLPTQCSFDKQKVFSILQLDKKRNNAAVDFILLDKIGEAKIQQIPLTQLEDLMNQLL